LEAITGAKVHVNPLTGIRVLHHARELGGMYELASSSRTAQLGVALLSWRTSGKSCATASVVLLARLGQCEQLHGQEASMQFPMLLLVTVFGLSCGEGQNGRCLWTKQVSTPTCLAS